MAPSQPRTPVRCRAGRYTGVLRALTILVAIVAALPASAASDLHPLYREAQILIDGSAGNLDALRLAELLLDRLHDEDPASPLPYVGWGRILTKSEFLGNRRYGSAEGDAKALELFGRAQEIDPGLLDAWVFAAYPYAHQRDFASATRMALQAESLAPDSPRLHLLYAYLAKKRGDHDEVIRRCRRALETTDDRLLISFAHADLARTYAKLERPDLAERSYLAVIELRPDSAWAHTNYSRFLSSQDRFDAAIAEARRGLEIMDFVRGDEMLAHAYYSKGAHLYWDLKRKEEAAPWFAKAIEENPRSANALYGLSLVHYERAKRAGRPEDLARSRDLLARALEVKPSHRQARRQVERLEQWMTEHAGKDGAGPRALRAEVEALFTRFDQEYDIARLADQVSRAIPDARIRGIGSYEYSILQFGEPSFDLEQLRRGQLPYHLQGDFDCDGKSDRAVLLDAPKRMLVLTLGTGDTLALPDYDGDALTQGSRGSHLTAAGKGHGTAVPTRPGRFESHCDFVSVHWWGKSSYAVVYDPTAGNFERYWTSD